MNDRYGMIYIYYDGSVRTGVVDIDTAQYIVSAFIDECERTQYQCTQVVRNGVQKLWFTGNNCGLYACDLDTPYGKETFAGYCATARR